MKNKTNLVFIVFLISFAIYANFGCSSYISENKMKKFYVNVIDSTLFRDYIFIFLNSETTDNILLLSKRNLTVNNLRGYEKIQRDRFYNLNLTLIDTVIQCKTRANTPDVYRIDDRVIWFNDTIRTPVYMTNDVKDVFIRIN